MHSFERINGQLQYTGSLPQTAPHFSHNASSTWSANNMHQYMNASSGVQQSHSSNISFHNVVSANGQVPNRQCAEGLHLPANCSNNNLKDCNRMLSGNPTNTSNSFPSPTSGPQILTLHSHSYYANQSLVSFSSPTVTYSSPTVSYPSPTVSYSSPTVSYPSPTVSYSSPTVTYSSPTVSFCSPTASYSSPTASYSSPTVSYSSPTASYSSPTVSYSSPTASYSSPTVSYSSPTASYSSPTVSYSSPNTTYHYWNRTATGNEVQTSRIQDASHLQQNQSSHSFHQPSTGYVTPYARSLPYQQMVNPCSSMSAVSQNVQTYQMAYYNSEIQSSSTLVQNFSNTSEKSQQARTQPNSSCYNYEGPTDSRNTNLNNQYTQNSELPMNYNAQQQVVRNQLNADNFAKSSTVGSSHQLPPPSYESHHMSNISRQSNQTMQPVTSVVSQSCNLSATQPVSLHSVQTLPQGSLSRGPLTVNPLQQNTLPVGFTMNTAAGVEERKKVVNVSLPSNNMVSKSFPAGSQNEGPSEKKSVRINKANEYLKKYPTLMNILEQSPTVQPDDDSAQPVPAHPVTRAAAVAVVLPLSQEDGRASSYTPTCDPKNITDKECITPEVANEPAFVERSNVDQEDPNLVTVNNTVARDGVVYLKNCEQLVQDLPAQTLPKAQNEATTPPSPPALELSSIPTVTWTMDPLNNLLLETEKAQVEPRENLKHPVIDQILYTFWNLDIEACHKSYRGLMESNHITYIDLLCKHIPKDHIILSEVHPAFREHLKQYHVLKDDDVYSEPPYKSLWLNINDQLDDIDKEFGFPWILMQHHYVQETFSQINTTDDIPELVAHKVQNKVSSQQVSEIVDLTDNDEEVSAVATPLIPSEDTFCDSNYSFKLDVLPPEEARAIYENVQNPINQNPDVEDVMEVSGSLQPKISNDMDAAAESNMKNEPEQIQVICCFAKFREMHSPAASSSLKCMCKEKQSFNELIVKPDLENISENTDNKPITLSSPEHCFKIDQIIELTNVDDDLYSHSDQASDTSDDSCDVEDADFIPTEPERASENVNLAIAETQSEDETLKGEVKSTETIQCASSVSSATQREHEELHSSETEDVLQMSDHEENSEQAEEAELCLENEGQTQITNPTSSSIHIEEKTNEERQEKQSSHDQFFPGLSLPKKPKLPTSPVLLGVPEAQPEASEIKTVRLALFGSKTRRNYVLSRNKTSTYMFSKPEPPEILSLKLDPSTRKPTESGLTGNYSVKQYLYQVWRNSMPTLNGSVKNGRKNKLKRQKRQHASGSTKDSKEEHHSESDRKQRSSLSLKKRRKRGCYGVTVCQPKNQDPEKKQDVDVHAMPLQENIILRFRFLPNTFNFKNESNRVMEAPGPESDEAKVKEEKDQSPGPVEQSKDNVSAPHPVPVPDDLCAQFQRASKDDVIAVCVEDWPKLTSMPEPCVAPIKIWKLLAYPENSSYWNDHTYHLSN